ncbi:unnamed protein product [Owenia fusiformis]|uniref:Uncharacterized protein n=1 Tax=Owenia fusiformis TaxID=6347 RepID=A0A8J1UTA1_OWEFU|nr:unnamed protein product [Owenia fusiformis]
MVCGTCAAQLKGFSVIMESITILHFNDVYNIEPQEHEPKGGAARMASYIDSVRDLNPLVLFSGDALNPSLMSSITKGEQMGPILSAMNVQCAVYGNHDFDFGVDELLEVTENTNFPWLMSNVRENITFEPLANGLEKHTIQWDGIKFGLIGLVEKEWLATLATVDEQDVTFLDFVEEGQRLSQELRNEGCDFIIALTHMRWPNDRIVAEDIDVDIVLGGHDHDYIIEQLNGKYIIKSGTDFRNMSKITLQFIENQIRDIQIEEIVLDSTIEEKIEVKEIVDSYMLVMSSKMEEELGQMEVELDGRFSKIRTQETNLGNFIMDIVLAAVNCDLAMCNSGTFRSDRIHSRGTFRKRDLLSILPMIDPMVVIEISGAAVIEALENGVSQYPALEGRFPQVAGISFGFDPNLPEGERVDRDHIRIQGEPLETERLYRLCTKHYLSLGKDGYTMFKDCPVLINDEEGPTLSVVVQNHFNSIKILKGLKRCKSGHKQSVISTHRRQSLTRSLSLNDGDALVPMKRPSRGALLQRQTSIHDVEVSECNLAPCKDGRIYLIDSSKFHTKLKPSNIILQDTISEGGESDPGTP